MYQTAHIYVYCIAFKNLRNSEILNVHEFHKGFRQGMWKPVHVKHFAKCQGLMNVGHHHHAVF